MPSAVYYSSFRNADLIETMKLSCLELISSLCNKSDLNREYIGQNDGISLLLRCMDVRDGKETTAVCLTSAICTKLPKLSSGVHRKLVRVFAGYALKIEYGLERIT